MQNGTKPYLKGKETMSINIVQSYILGHNFTEIHPSANARPPAIGEEHEAISMDERMSSHSSVSGKSEVSTATPRRTDMDLGYEPEGSASPLPAHERWKLSMYNMLEDNEGVTAFKQFLASSQQENILECWLAMKGFKNFDRLNKSCGSISSDEKKDLIEKRTRLARKIYKTYIANGAIKSISTVVKDATRDYILKQIKIALKTGCDLESELFHQAQTELELNVESNAYKQFLASKEFSQYAAQCDSLSPKIPSPGMHSNLSQSPKMNQSGFLSATDEQNNEKASPGSSQPYLPRLDENQVWSPSKDTRPRLPASSIRSTWGGSLAKTAIHQSISNNQASSKRHADASSTAESNVEKRPAYPYYTPSGEYWVPPASAIGSDQASKSSDATSDTLSCTDNSSVDGMASYSCGRSGQKRMIRNHIKKNPSNALPECVGFVQRTSKIKTMTDVATKKPAVFFEDLKQRLLEVIEKRNSQQQKLIANARARAAVEAKQSVEAKQLVTTMAEPTIKGVEEDVEKMMESHLARVIRSPGGQCSPPNRHRQAEPIVKDAFYCQPKISGNADVISDRSEGNLNLRRKNAVGVNVGLVPGMAQNEVPDVDTPVDPVDKNKMITAWIQMPPASGHSSRTRRSLRGRPSVPPGIETVPENEPYVHPAGSTGLQSSATNHVYRKLQPLAQDPTMPPFDLPDADTTIEEVKRRLMEETDRSYEDIISGVDSLSADPNSMQQIPFSSSTFSTQSTSSSKPQRLADSVTEIPHHHERESDSDSSTETATFANTNNPGATQQKSSSVSGASEVSDTTTTVVYYMPHEPLAYKVHIPHQPLTLGLFKRYLSKKGNFKYFFKQFSLELKRPVYFEVANDNDILPRWDGIVLAKIEPNSG